MRVHSHPSFRSQLAILRCSSYLSVLYFPFIPFSVTRVPSRVDVFPFSSFRLQSIRYLLPLCVRHSSVLVPFPVCVTQGQPRPLSRTHACSRIYLCTSTLSFIIVLSPPFSSRSLCALRKPHTLDIRCRCHQSSSFSESAVRLFCNFPLPF